MNELLNDLRFKKSSADQDTVWAAEKRVQDAIQKKLRDEYAEFFEDIRVVFYPRRAK